jgi:ABC-2 type transport system permease protein
MIRAILWAQLLSMRPRKGRSGGGGAVFSAITGLLFYGMFTVFAWALMLLFSSPDATPHFAATLSALLLVMMLFWQLSPVISASFGASIDLRKLMAYPIPRRSLFLVEVLLRAITSVDMLLLLGGICTGLLRNPLFGAASAPFVLAGALAFAVMNVLLSAGIRSLLERFFLRTRFKEVFFLIVVLVSLTPQLLILANVKKPVALLRFVPAQTLWPWAAVAHLMLRNGTVAAALTAAAWVCLTALFSRRQFEKTLRFDGATLVRKKESAATRTDDSFTERIFRLPSRFFGDPLAALIEKELRTLSRIARFRMAYGMSCFFGVVMFAPALRRHNTGGSFLQYALPIMAVYGLLVLGQISYWNSFGFDRSAAQGYFCWPIRFRDALIAKNLTVLALMIPQIALVSMLARAFHIPSSPGKILETYSVAGVAALFWFGLGNICSVRMPRAMDPDKMNQMSNKMQALTILAAPVVLLPIVLAYWARSVFANDFVFAGILSVAAILGAIFYSVALDSAVETAHSSREHMLLQLSRSDGPISIT